MIEGDVVQLVLDANVFIDAVDNEDAVRFGSMLELAALPRLPPRRIHPALHVIGEIAP